MACAAERFTANGALAAAAAKTIGVENFASPLPPIESNECRAAARCQARRTRLVDLAGRLVDSAGCDEFSTQ
jgi:hypothetical protein